MGKKRVRCANCGLVYDIEVGDMRYSILFGDCPACKSTAFDELPNAWKREY